MSGSGREAYEAWADPASLWSAWAKPALFATYKDWPVPPPPPPEYPDTGWAPAADGRTVIIVDVPDGDAVAAGLALAARGFRPVPLFNGSAALRMVVDVTRLATCLASGAEVLRGLHLDPSAPPAFLLDSLRRLDTTRASPGRFDNRWVTFPQDFPSARKLAASGVTAVVLFASSVQSDLAHVLLRYQEAGLALTQVEPQGLKASPLTVAKPSRFRAIGYRAAVLVGLYRNPAGGFGGKVPEPSSSSG
jgi:hypothetical protein